MKIIVGIVPCVPFECSFEVITCVPLIYWFLFGIDELYSQDCEKAECLCNHKFSSDPLIHTLF